MDAHRPFSVSFSYFDSRMEDGVGRRRWLASSYDANGLRAGQAKKQLGRSQLPVSKPSNRKTEILPYSGKV